MVERRYTLCLTVKSVKLIFLQQVTGEMTVNFKHGATVWESQSVPVFIAQNDINQRVTLNMANCGFESQVLVRESNLNIDRSQKNMAAGKGGP